jgi:hypothetical protein
MIIGTILSTAFGAATSFAQDYLHHKRDMEKLDKEVTRDRERKMIDIEIAKQQKELGISVAKETTKQYEINLQAKEQDTEQAQAMQITQVSTNQKDSDVAFMDAVAKTQYITYESKSRLINIANFLSSTTRVFIAYLIGLPLALTVLIVLLRVNDVLMLFTEPYSKFTELLEYMFYTFDGIISYYYLRRSSEKSFNIPYNNGHNDSQKFDTKVKKK